MRWRWTFLLAIGAAAPVAAQEGVAPQDRATASGRDRDWFVSGYAMVWAESRLTAFPRRIVTADLPLRDAYLLGVAANRVVVPRFTIPIPFTRGLRGNSLELEGQFVQHVGREHAPEVTAAAVVRSGQFGLVGQTTANVAWGNGFSYALASPDFEFGPEGVRGVNTRHLQYHMSFETEVTSKAAPRVHYVFRLHHRSGIYGVISPQRTGSNYLGVGLRFDLKR